LLKKQRKYDGGDTVAYYGCNGKEYIESYPSVDVR